MELLKDLRGLEPLKELFWSELSYDHINRPLPRHGWNQAAASALAEDPILFAGGGENNDFHVIYGRLAHDRLLLGHERPVVTQLLKGHEYALFVFSNLTQDHWHFINVKYDTDTKRRRLFRRITVSPDERLRTAAQRLSIIDLERVGGDLFGLSPLAVQQRHDEAFDVEAVTDQFFKEYKVIFRFLEDYLAEQTNALQWAHDYSLQFLNRCMFLYFIQRKGWLGGDRDFLMSFWRSYQRSGQPEDGFVERWLKVLFFEAFNNGFQGGHGHFSDETSQALSLAPYLNGGLFTENKLDHEHSPTISDSCFERIFEFLEQYNFTISEDSPLDKEVAVDPEMIGKVYESLVNITDDVDARGEAGIFFTPRTEIDLMCRLALVDHLANHLGQEHKSLLNQLAFSLEPDEKPEADEAVSRVGLWPALNERLRNITVLDPACGSGSFLVGMLSILDDLQERADRQLGLGETSYDRKKRIIGQSLYGVDVMEWACHVAELRLWLALIIDADFTREQLHERREPLLPHFSFKIRCGDSLVQEVGGINLGHSRESRLIPHHQFKHQITELKEQKLKFYNNDNTGRLKSVEAIRNEEKRLFLGMLDARHQAVQEQIKSRRRKLEGQQDRRIGLDGTVEAAPPHQVDLHASKYRQEVESLTTELAHLEAARKALSTAGEMPFVWDVAFVEVFEGEDEGFDIVIGNPPYVRQEMIVAPVVSGVQVTGDKKEYKAKLALSVYPAFPHFFGYKAGSNTVAHKIDAKSDLYIYFYLHGLSLLNDRGSFCFITSNSWLDVGYGADLQEFLLRHCHVKLVLDNQVKRTFSNADVNSIIVLFSHPDDHHEWGLDTTARFVMFRVPFEHILSAVIFDEIDEARERRVTAEYRVFPIEQGSLLEDGCAKTGDDESDKAGGPLIQMAEYIGNKWGGKYLRSPDIFLSLVETCKDLLLPLPRLVQKDYGIKPGCVEFFYVSEDSRTGFAIEDEFLVPIINSSRHIDSVYFYPNTKLFHCDEPKSRLAGTGALRYITWGEERGFHRIPSARAHRPYWYSLSGEPVDFLLLQFWDKRFWTPIAKVDPCYCSNNFFYGRCLEDRDNILVQMNSSWYFMQTELFGRVNQGQGVLTTYGTDFDVVRLIKSSAFTSEQTERGTQLLNQIGERPIRPIWEEVDKADHKALDDIVFDVLGLSQYERDEFRHQLVQLVRSRLERADSSP